MGHPYIPNDTESIQKHLLDAIGVNELDELFSDIPDALRLKRQLSLPFSRSEYEVRKEVEDILAKNITDNELLSFLGGGVWSHIVPSAVDSVASRAEYVTSYTPYQPEISQGMLQALYEYQSLVCELLDMDVVNSSMYDWASGLGEAARMANRVTGRKQILHPHLIHPERLATLRAYAEPVGISLVEVGNNLDDGQIDTEDVKGKVSSETAALYVENPSYLGPLLLNLQELGQIVHDKGGLLIAGVDPISLGLLKPPGEYGADIAIGEGQPLGSYVNFGGPLLGVFACREETRFIRQMPGRIIGMTRTRDGQTGYCMVLQTREQHIRREKATSNICTNEALLSVRAAIYLALLGPNGLRHLGEYVTLMSNYLMHLLSQVVGLDSPAFKAPHFKEFVLRVRRPKKTVPQLNQRLLERGILGGHCIMREFPELGESALICVTERHTRADLERLAEAVTLAMEE